MKGMFDIYQSITNRSVLKQLSSKQITYCNHTDFQGKILFSTVRPTLLILFYKMVIIIAEAVLFWKDSISHFFPTYSSFFFFLCLNINAYFSLSPVVCLFLAWITYQPHPVIWSSSWISGSFYINNYFLLSTILRWKCIYISVLLPFKPNLALHRCLSRCACFLLKAAG